MTRVTIHLDSDRTTLVFTSTWARETLSFDIEQKLKDKKSNILEICGTSDTALIVKARILAIKMEDM